MNNLKFRAVLNGKVRYDVTGFEHGSNNQMDGVFLNGDYHTINEDCVVEQFTGVQGCGGKDVYDGDLISNNFGTDKEVVRKVIFQSGGWVAMHVSGKTRMGRVLDLYEIIRLNFKIVGNIHEAKKA